MVHTLNEICNNEVENGNHVRALLYMSSGFLIDGYPREEAQGAKVSKKVEVRKVMVESCGGGCERQKQTDSAADVNIDRIIDQ